MEMGKWSREANRGPRKPPRKGRGSGHRHSPALARYRATEKRNSTTWNYSVSLSERRASCFASDGDIDWDLKWARLDGRIVRVLSALVHLFVLCASSPYFLCNAGSNASNR